MTKALLKKLGSLTRVYWGSKSKEICVLQEHGVAPIEAAGAGCPHAAGWRCFQQGAAVGLKVAPVSAVFNKC